MDQGDHQGYYGCILANSGLLEPSHPFLFQTASRSILKLWESVPRAATASPSSLSDEYLLVAQANFGKGKRTVSSRLWEEVIQSLKHAICAQSWGRLSAWAALYYETS